eukprot:UN17757
MKLCSVYMLASREHIDRHYCNDSMLSCYSHYMRYYLGQIQRKDIRDEQGFLFFVVYRNTGFPASGKASKERVKTNSKK